MTIQTPLRPSDTIAALAQARSSDTLKSADLVERALNRAEALRSAGSHALTRVWREEALAAARYEDRLQDQGVLAPSLLAGMPIVVKDNCDVRGDITQAGSGSLSNALPAQRDADCVAHLRAAGAIIVGKSNMSEFACANTGFNEVFGTPTNPRDPSRLVGGSSSGAAAAVADGSMVAALGSDTGGSIRGPAALCGLVGFKPSEGRVSTRGVLPLSTTLDTLGPIARSVECCAIMDAVLAAETWRPLPEYPLQGVSLGVLQDLVLDDLDPSVASAFENALRVLREAGATVTEFTWAELQRRDWRKVYTIFTRSEMYANHGRFAEENGQLIEPRPLEVILSGRSISPQDRTEALAFRRKVVLDAHDIISRFHAVVMPTVPVVAPLISTLSDPEQAARVEQMIGRNNEPANFFDCCAATVPCQPMGELPVGFLMMAKNGEDRRVLAIAHAVENTFRARGLG
ncbi:amidase family protein [Microvirga sp. VF16]|uniref:amidase family protein n=1 Tax=Microvirga sp. VF16 TaxID=2807101 RepID=UPI00193D73B8|nr:amidase family protein [Microvirga sp. VF16]QRM32880.1 amidase [Microvirga sp. VF16]